MGPLSPALSWGCDQAPSIRPGDELEDHAFDDYINHWVDASSHLWKLADSQTALTREPATLQEQEQLVSQEEQQVVSQELRTKLNEKKIHNGRTRIATVFVETSVDCSSDSESSSSHHSTMVVGTNYPTAANSMLLRNSDHTWQDLGFQNMVLQVRQMQRAVDTANEARAAAEKQLAELQLAATAAAESLALKLQQSLQEKMQLQKELEVSQAKRQNLSTRLKKASEILKLLQSPVYR